jgi:hypothetical protein
MEGVSGLAAAVRVRVVAQNAVVPAVPAQVAVAVVSVLKAMRNH